MPRPEGNARPALAALLDQNRTGVRRRVAAAAADARRPEEAVRMIAVTKKVEPEVALALRELGERDLGEARVDALERKVEAFRAAGVDAVWHFIGHLQRNKARRVARLADEIHAVDTKALLGTLARVSSEEGVSPALYLQVKLTDEPAKHGLAPETLPELVGAARDAGQRLRGLMAMAPLGGDLDAARAVFERLAELREGLDAAAFLDGRPRLSMGMSGDLEVAIAAGADDVRIGTALFRGLDEPKPNDEEAA